MKTQNIRETQSTTAFMILISVVMTTIMIIMVPVTTTTIIMDLVIIMILPVLVLAHMRMKSLQSTLSIHMELFVMWINLEVSVKYYT